VATRKGDVDLVIRARNEASKALDGINKALADLVGIQNDVSASSKKTGDALSDFSRLATTVGNAFNKINSDADRAAATFERQEKALAENQAAYQSILTQMEAAVRAQARLRAESQKEGADKKELAAQLKLVETAYKSLSSQANRLSETINRQERDLRASYYALQDLRVGAEQAANALDKVREAEQRAGDAAAAAAAKQQQAAQAVARRSSLELRRSMQEAAGSAQTGWREAQTAIRDLATEISRVGVPTSQMVADMTRLQQVARANKQAYTELQVAIEQYTRVLRTQGASQQDIAAAQERARAALAGSRNMMVELASVTQRNATATREFGEASNRAAGGATNLDRALVSLFANSRRSLSLYQRMRGEVLSLISTYVGLYAAIEGVNRIIQASMDMQAVESRLNVVTGGDAQATAREMQWIRSESERLGFSMKSLANEWSKFAVAAQASNFSMDETRRIFTAVSEAGRVLKLNSQQVERSFVAITQMMSKGTISAEELRQQLGEHIPGAFALMAEAAGVSGAELSKMMERGELTTEYLLKFADVLEKRFGGQLSKALETTQAEMGRFETALTIALNKIADSGVIDEFTAALRELTELLKRPEAEVYFERIGAAIGGVIKFLMSLLKNMDMIISALVLLGSAKAASYIMQLGAAFATTVTAAGGAGAAVRGLGAAVLGLRAGIPAVTALSAGFGGLGAAMSALAGPVGILVGALAAGFTFLATRVSEADVALKRVEQNVNKITQAYNNGTSSAKEWVEALKGMSELEMAADLKRLRQKLQGELEQIVQPFGRAFMSRVERSDSPLKPVYQEIQRLVEEARKGNIPLNEFRERLDNIGKEHPELAKVATSLIQMAGSAVETEEAVRKLEAAIRLKNGAATEADRKLLGLASAMDESSTAATRGADALGKYTKAMENMAKMIPELKRQLEFEENVEKLRKELQDAFDGATGKENEEELKRAAMDRAATIMAGVKRAFDEALINDLKPKRGDALYQSVQLLREFEGFRATAYKDNDGRYRVGYGSDTVTLDERTIQKVTQATTVSMQDALRDLVRRIGEFQETIKTQIGSERWSAFTPEQQAALTSIAYNYGSLPKRIIEAVRTGTGEQIADAVRRLAGDNGGINRRRRFTEAALFEQPNAALAANTQKQIQSKVDQTLKVVTDLNKQITQIGLTEREKYIRDALERAGISAAVKAVEGMLERGNIDLTKRPQVRNEDGTISTVRSISVEVDGKVALVPTVSDDGRIMSDEEAIRQFQQTGKHLGIFNSEEAAEKFAEELHKQQERFYSDEAQRLAKLAGEAFDAQAAEKARIKINELQAQLSEGRKAISREEYIANEARKEGIDLLSEQGKKYAELKGQLFDREQAEKRVNDLMALRREIQQQIEFNRDQGNFDAASALQSQLNDVNDRLREAIQSAIEFWQSIGGPMADIAIARLENLGNSIQNLSERTIQAKTINDQFASGAANAFATAGDAIGAFIEGSKSASEVFEDIRDAFLKFAADFLRQIAQMIIQQMIFNLISGGATGSGGIGSWIAGGINSLIRHDGGLVGAGGPMRFVSPGLFASAVRYHTGGIAGLAPNEVPAILERGEEVLTRDDPRHVANGGGAVNVKVVNAIDAGDFVSQGMNTDVGQEAILNYIRSNSSAVRAALGQA